MVNIYKGEFVNDKIEGRGTFNYANGAKYQGECKDREMNGIGTLIICAKNAGLELFCIK
ncbi:hypothetical protein [Clostridium sp. YIM B02569]|uniref:hypothetical protein n=1 Tax=Clostridium sp. YIM B02569 TaxID=2911967 RepID=UPI001EEE925E|nr:hypothetical protein [Clostridium sp. YIM B02569]